METKLNQEQKLWQPGHECLAKHLHRFKILPSDNCMLCKLPDTVMDSHHLTQCAALKDNDNRDMAALYWDALMVHILTNLMPLEKK